MTIAVLPGHARALLAGRLPDWIEARGPCALLQLQLEEDAQCWSISRGDGRVTFEVLSAEGERRAALALGPEEAEHPEHEER